MKKTVKRGPYGCDEQSMQPSTLAILKGLYWTVRKDHAAMGHVLKAVARSIARFIVLRQQKARSDHRPLVVLALVEHMGDIVAAEPLARAAKAKFPDARIAWITREPYRSLPEAYPEIDETIVVQCLTEWMLIWSYGVVDVVWDLHLSDRRCPVCNTAFRKPGAQGKVTYETYYDLGNLLETQCMVAGLETPKGGPVLRSTPTTNEAVDALGLPASFVVIHAKSNDAQRDWVDWKWAKLVDHLRETFGGHVVEIGMIPLVIQSDAERQRCLCGKLSILETAEVIRRSRLFVGLDSGPAHLANAVGTPGVVLLGDYNAFRNHMPYSGFYATESGATILRASGPVANLTDDAVIRTIDERLAGLRKPELDQVLDRLTQSCFARRGADLIEGSERDEVRDDDAAAR